MAPDRGRRDVSARLRQIVRQHLPIAALLVALLIVPVEFGVVGAYAPASTRIAALLLPQDGRRDSSSVGTLIKTNIPYVDAQPLFELLRQDLLPPELREKTASERQLEWPNWVKRRDAEIRSRLLAGDEASIVNLLFFGTRFTKEARVQYADIPNLDQSADARVLIQTRLDDFVVGIASPGTNGRLRFARAVVTSQGMTPATAAGRRQVRAYLVRIMRRAVDDHRRYEQATWSLKLLADSEAELSGRSTLYRDRGLSSDTSLFPDFAVEEALKSIKAAQLLGDREVRRVAIIGPGLDIANKDEGYDFYPEQTLQPFAVIDSLIRLGLAGADPVRTMTFDLNPQVTQHLAAARLRARAGQGYTVELARNTNERWNSDLVKYLERFGDTIGQQTIPVTAPSNVGGVEVRAVRIRPAVILGILPQDLNVIVQRVEPVTSEERFDLIVATNLLIYYDVFEQALALANVAKMLRPGGLFLSNDFVFPAANMSVAGYTDVPYTDAGDGDRIWWYQRQ